MQLPGGIAGSGCPVTTYQVFDEDCSTPSQDFENAENLLTTLDNGVLKALVKDNINYKIFKGCIKITAENNPLKA